LGAFIKALQSENILQILAEPNLVTTNGKEAYFLVGGEFPVPILQGGSNSGSVTVQFREFGIRLRFTPVITANNTIKMHLNQEVSTIDTANGVTVSGFSIPALATRRARRTWNWVKARVSSSQACSTTAKRSFRSCPF
jgi:pilus assembly protein CpaC